MTVDLEEEQEMSVKRCGKRATSNQGTQSYQTRYLVSHGMRLLTSRPSGHLRMAMVKIQGTKRDAMCEAGAPFFCPCHYDTLTVQMQHNL